MLAMAVRCIVRVHAEVEHRSCFLCQRLSFVRARFFLAALHAADGMQPSITNMDEKTTCLAGGRGVSQTVCMRLTPWTDPPCWCDDDARGRGGCGGIRSARDGCKQAPQGTPPSRTKVFCFFFSKKKRLLQCVRVLNVAVPSGNFLNRNGPAIRYAIIVPHLARPG